MEAISQRELRNDNARIMREIEGGAEFVVTRRGVPVARLVSAGGAEESMPVRPARSRRGFAQRHRVAGAAATAEILADLRGER